MKAKNLLGLMLYIGAILMMLIGCSRNGLRLKSSVPLQGRLALFTDKGDYIIDLETFKKKRINAQDTGGWSLPGRWAPNGQKFVLTVMDIPSSPSWLPSPPTSPDPFSIAIFDLETNEQTVIAQKVGYIDVPDWSPNGQWLAFVLEVAPHPVMVMRTDGSDFHSVVDCGKGHCCCARWSPDGDRIAFASGNGLEVVDFDGLNRELLYGLQGVHISELEWSRESSDIAFFETFKSADTYKDGLKLLNPLSKEVSQIPLKDAPMGWAWDLAWSPAGDKLAIQASFRTERYSGDRLLIVDLDGQELMNTPTEQVFEIAGIDWAAGE